MTRQRTILVVDDSEATRGMYVTRLRTDGYRVLEAGDGEAGVALAVAERPDLIFLNLALPELDGWAAASRLKSDVRTATIPVVAVTGFVEPRARSRARKAGCDGYLEKPCQPSRIAEEARRRLGGG